MINYFIFFFYFIGISGFSLNELVHLKNNESLLVNEEGIFKFKNNFLRQIILRHEKENRKTSDFGIGNEFHNIYAFQCLEDKICIFINDNLFIFSLEGNVINKFIISEDLVEYKYVVIPYNIDIKKENTFNFIMIYIDRKGDFIANFYLYNKLSESNALLFKNNILIYNDTKNEINKYTNNFSCQLISNSFICFFFNQNEILIKKFYVDLENKKIESIKFREPIKKFNFNGKMIKSFVNKENSKILIVYSKIDNNNIFKGNECIIYNIIENKYEFIKDIPNNINNNLEIILDFKSNIDNISFKNEFILYNLNSSNELSIIELNDCFQIESKNIFILDNKYPKYQFNFFDFSIINYIRNYQVILFIKKNNNYENNTISSIFTKHSRNTIKRNLQENNGGNPYNNEPNNGPNEDGLGLSQSVVEGENRTDGGNRPESGNDEGNDGEGNGDMGNNKERKGETKGGFYFDFDNKNTTIPRSEIKDNRGSIMSNVIPGESYELKGDDYSIRVAPMGEKQEGNTYIDFMDCEKRLREYYNLTSNSTLSVFQTEVTSSNNKSLTNKLQYVVYDENNTQLNLSVCEDQQIKINYAIKNDSGFNLNSYSFFEEKGIDILNSSDPFFNDICYTYSNGSSDIILSDRINEIYQNFSLCDSGCEYEGLNISSGTISCSCSVSDSDDSDEDDEADNLKQIILSLFSDSTFGVIQCYNKVFSSSKASNIGFWIFLLITIGHIPLYVLFFMKGTSQIKDYIRGEMEKYHYLKNPEQNDNIKESEKENNISNPPKNSKDAKEKNPYISRNIENDLNTKSENLNIIKNTAETEDDEKKSKDDPNKILQKEENLKFQNYNINLPKDMNNTNESSSKRDANQNAIIVYQTEETFGDRDIISKRKETKETGKKFIYFLIQIDANNSPDSDKPVESNYILNNYEYETAIKYESRTFWRILYIIMISKDNILNIFFLSSPLDSKPLQICLLIFAYTSDLALNTLFYFSDNISDKYHYTGDNLFWYTLFNNILISVISTLLSLILGMIMNLMVDSKDNIEDEFKEEEKKLRKDKNYKVSEERKKEIVYKIDKELKKLKFKMILFVVVDFIIILFFFYFVTAFCEVYSNTQTSWISDAVVSIIISFPIELAILFAITVVYILSIKYKWKFVYKLAMLLA